MHQFSFILSRCDLRTLKRKKKKGQEFKVRTDNYFAKEKKNLLKFIRFLFYFVLSRKEGSRHRRFSILGA